MVPGVLLIRFLGLYVVVGFPVEEWGLGFLIPSSDVKSAGHLSCLASEELGHGPSPLLLGDFSSCICPKKKMAIWQALTHTRGLFSIQTLNSSVVLWRGRAGVSSTLAGCGSPWVCVQLWGRETGLFCPWQQGPKPVSLFGSAFAELKSWLLAAYISVSPNVRPSPFPSCGREGGKGWSLLPLDQAAGKPGLVWDHHFPHAFVSLVAVASVGKCWPHASGLREESSSCFSFLEMLPVFFFKPEKGLQADHALLDIQNGTCQTVCPWECWTNETRLSKSFREYLSLTFFSFCYRQKIDSRVCKAAINKFHSNLKEELIKMVSSVT